MKMKFAKSLSGHDRNQYYLIVKEDEDAVYLVNGTTRTLGKPKKKNPKHIQVILHVPPEAEEALSEGLTDLTVKRAVKIYEQSIRRKAECQRQM